MYKIILVGAGQIGSRYLQGLAKLKENIEITVLDPNKNSLKIAKSRWNEVAINQNKVHKIEWITDFQNHKNVDLAIIATSSKNRDLIVKKVSDIFRPTYWIIEKVLAQSKEQIDSILKVTNKSMGAWVNTSKRIDEWHKKISVNFNIKGPLKVEKMGGLWGMACNSIHFIDLVSWWTGEDLISIDVSKLEKNWFRSKRDGYFEITGEIKANFSNGSELILKSLNHLNDEYIKVYLPNKNEILINEHEGLATSSDGQKLTGKIELQSNVTTALIKKLILENKCSLPTLKFSSKQHKIFIESMLYHWNNCQKLNDTKVPIT